MTTTLDHIGTLAIAADNSRTDELA